MNQIRREKNQKQHGDAYVECQTWNIASAAGNRRSVDDPSHPKKPFPRRRFAQGERALRWLDGVLHVAIGREPAIAKCDCVHSSGLERNTKNRVFRWKTRHPKRSVSSSAPVRRMEARSFECTVSGMTAGVSINVQVCVEAGELSPHTIGGALAPMSSRAICWFVA